MFKYAFISIVVFVSLITALKVVEDRDINLVKKEVKIIPASNYCAWIPYWDQERSVKSLEASENKLSYISPVWYFIDEKAQVKEYTKADKTAINNALNKEKTKIVATIFNEFDPKRISLLINNHSLYQDFASELVSIAQKNNYSGWDIDFEEIGLENKKSFSGFIEYLANELHKNDLVLSVSVHVQTGRTSDWEAARAQDWESISRSADTVRVMAYDFHNTKTSPGPITPIDRLEEVLKFASLKIPVEKLVIGLPLYGYNWSNKNTVAMEYQDATKSAQANNAEFQRDAISSALTANYAENNTDHTIWVEDAQSVISKINLARDYGIYQFCFWRLGGEDLSLWRTLK